jgi:hypothetical protein
VAPRVALPALLVQAALSVPSTDNHFFLELYAVGLLCLAGERDDDAWLLGSLRWLAAIVLFQTGLQKVLYGQYFSGQLLAFLIGQGDRFALPFEWLVSAQEVARLQGYDPLRTGAGPYRVDSLLFVALSNGVWIAELALAPLLLLARTRLAATGAAIALVAAIQLGARELGFAFLFTSLLLLFTRQGNARALPWLGVLYLYALAAVWLGLPGGDWLDPGSL